MKIVSHRGFRFSMTGDIAQTVKLFAVALSNPMGSQKIAVMFSARDQLNEKITINVGGGGVELASNCDWVEIDGAKIYLSLSSEAADLLFGKCLIAIGDKTTIVADC